MKTLITVLGFALSFGSLQAANTTDIPFVKFVSAEEELINPFDHNIQVASLEDTIRRDRQITESEIEDQVTVEGIDDVIAEDIKITDAQLPVYQPLDWGFILRSRVIKPTISIGTNL